MLRIAFVSDDDMQSHGMKKNPVHRTLLSDARHFQLLVLGSLLGYGIAHFTSTPVMERVVALIASSLLTQWVFTRYLKLPRFDFRSPLITSFSLGILLRPGNVGWAVLAGVLAIGSKFILSHKRRHFFNPAAFAIGFLTLCTGQVWVSPGQWGSATWLVLLVACCGLVVSQRATRLDISLAFLIAYAAGILGRAAWLGDPMSIPIRQLQSGAVILFAFFMISDPKTTPDRRSLRIVFGTWVGLLAVVLQFNWIHPIYYGLFYALFFSAPLVPWMNARWPGPVFQWGGLPPTCPTTNPEPSHETAPVPGALRPSPVQ